MHQIQRQSSSTFRDGSGRTGKLERCWYLVKDEKREVTSVQVAALTMDLNLGIVSEGEKRLKKKLILDYIYSNLRWANQNTD